MIKQTIEYEDFLGGKQVDTLRFVITKTRLTENMHLKDRLEILQRMLGGDTKTMSMAEVQQIIDLVKEFIRLSYGELSEDGKTFRQDEELYIQFKHSAAYDAFLFSLFQNPEKAIDFMIGVLPKDLTDQARVQIEKGEVELTGSPVLVSEPPVAPQASDPTAPVTSTVSPATDERSLSSYSRQELMDMPQAEFERLAGRNAQELKQNGMLEIAFERRSRG